MNSIEQLALWLAADERGIPRWNQALFARSQHEVCVLLKFGPRSSGTAPERSTESQKQRPQSRPIGHQAALNNNEVL